jgi:hypothetical protein
MALSIVAFILARYNSKTPAYMLWLACSMLTMGILNGFHACVSPGREFVWLHCGAHFTGGVLIALIWLPKEMVTRPLVKWLPKGVAFVTVLFGIISINYPNLTPVVLDHGQFTSEAILINIFAGVLFLSGAVFFGRIFYLNGGVIPMLFSAFCLLFSVAGVIFTFSVLWDAGWWIWHLMQTVAFAIALGYIGTASTSKYKRLVQTETQIVRMNHFQTSLLRPGTIAEKSKKITDAVVDMFDADFCRIWLTAQGDLCESGCMHAKITEGPHVCRYRDKCLHLEASSGRYTHIDGRVHRRVPFACYKIGRVASDQERRFLTNDVTHDPRVHDHKWATDLGLVSFAGYQLRPPGGETIGVLALFSKHTVSSNEDALLENMANITAQAMQTVRAEEYLARNMKELEAFNQLAVGRELKMIELKEEINQLLVQSGLKAKYEVVE